MKLHVMKQASGALAGLLVSAGLFFVPLTTYAQPAANVGGAAPKAEKPDLIQPGDALLHPWVVPAPASNRESYFTNLVDGGTYESPFVARFGVSMRGLVPAGKTAGRAGHHHLLINQPLPLDFTKPLPFTEKYLHFGKGQMQALVDLPPGKYDLRMLLADQGHIPYFVYSKPLHITVSKQNKGVSPATVLGPRGISLLSPGDGERPARPFRVQFHANGYHISHVAAQAPDTGHFRLTVERTGSKPEVLDFISGYTESWLNPPPGEYKLQLELVSNVDKSVQSRAAPVSVTVVRTAPTE